MEAQSDSSAMQAVQNGDIAQLAVLFDRYHLPLFRYLFHLTRSRTLSEDLVQETFFRVLKYAQSYDPAQPFRVWLYEAARHLYLDSLRKGCIEANADQLCDLPSRETLPDQRLTRDQDFWHLQDALARLPEAKREVLILSRFSDLRYEEIARILHIEVGAVKVRVHRALRELREAFCEIRGEKSL